ncbi:hypothetical protein [Exiguobacterium sp. S22-S28]|uniref:hypothetical protein n=1 Tax=Exiguobacterium sp. S22-S28 TaxID=3342768 RepID=UPI00372D09BF
MTWHIQITTYGPAAEYVRGFSNHLNVHEEELLSGHRVLYLGSPHLDILSDPIQAIYRAKTLIAVFTSIQRLLNDQIWSYDLSQIFYTDYQNSDNNGRYSMSPLHNETMAFEETLNPYGATIPMSKNYYKNIYHQYLSLAQNDNLVHTTFILLDDAYKSLRYYYINLYKILETIKNDWSQDAMLEFSSEAVNAFDALHAGNVRGYMNQFSASGLLSRHGYTKNANAHSNVSTPPPIFETKTHLLMLTNRWLNYKISLT